MIKKESFKHCKDYIIYSNGKVYSKNVNRFLSPVLSANYLSVSLKVDSIGNRKLLLVHRLVASHFIPNRNSLPEVNHKDGNKLNNKMSNLEWMTKQQNIKHSFEKLGRKNPFGINHHMAGKKHSKETKRKMSIAKLGDLHPKFKGYYLINGIEYGSAYEAAKHIGVSYKTVYRWCYGNKNGCSFIDA